MTDVEQHGPDVGADQRAEMILLDCDGVAVVILRGEHDLATADELRAFLLGSANTGVPLVVDLTDLEFADSSTFRVFIAIEERLRTSGRRLVFQLSESSPAYRTMTIMGLDGLFACAPSRDTAIDAARHTGIEG